MDKYWFIALEMIQFVDVIHHINGISKLRPHVFMHHLTTTWMLWFVIEMSPNHYINFYWMAIRVIERIIKHVYNVYIAMGLRFELVWLDYFRFSSFYVLYPLELLCSYAVIYHLYPDIRKLFEYDLGGFTLDYGVCIFMYIGISIPNFLNTFHYLNNKKKQLLGLYSEKVAKED
mmetsp:Transcript_31013/g.30560  ORF Transcript_31013/g.30560 Transcript_31013/m.30560 type:complete len:174 (-) Transcript_31013:63-584(-)